MYSFGKVSKERLATCDPRLQEIMNEVIKYIDISIICGHRGREEQDEVYRTGKSKVKWPNGKHNTLPSKAVDVALYHKSKPNIRWDKKEEFIFLYGIVYAIAAQKGIKIRAGVDFNGDLDFTNDSFFDGPHFELVD